MRAKVSLAEQLEGRRLLYTAYVIDGVLQVDGDENDNVIRVYAEPASSMMNVEIDGVTAQFPLNSFTMVRIEAYDGNDLIYAEHNNVVTGKIWELYGNGGDDTIHGTSGNDFIRGQRGNDLIYSYGGNDRIYGDEDRDTIYGGDGDDTINGNFGGDLLVGGPGNDSLMGGLGLDTLYGDEGDDMLFSGNGMDHIYAGPGNDYVESRGKADTVFGGPGNDTIISGAGADLVYGEEGDDVIYATSHVLFVDTLDGGAGFDRYEADDNDILINMEEAILA